jgi:cytochrome c biogenesis protein ResB
VTGFTRKETTLELAAGEQSALGNGATLRVVSLEALRYDNGSPRDWVSTVDVAGPGVAPVAAYPVSVNHPLRLRGFTVYQSSWETRGILDVTGSDGGAVTAVTGQGFTEGDSFWYFAEVKQESDQWHAVFEQYRGKSLVGSRSLSAGDTIGPFRVRRVSAADVTGLKVVRDPGLAPFLSAAALILLGLGLTLAQRRAEGRA